MTTVDAGTTWSPATAPHERAHADLRGVRRPRPTAPPSSATAPRPGPPTAPTSGRAGSRRAISRLCSSPATTSRAPPAARASSPATCPRATATGRAPSRCERGQRPDLVPGDRPPGRRTAPERRLPEGHATCVAAGTTTTTVSDIVPAKGELCAAADGGHTGWQRPGSLPVDDVYGVACPSARSAPWGTKWVGFPAIGTGRSPRASTAGSPPATSSSAYVPISLTALVVPQHSRRASRWRGHRRPAHPDCTETGSDPRPDEALHGTAGVCPGRPMAAATGVGTCVG